MYRIQIPNNLVEEIYQLCLRQGADWYYFDYYKKKRKTMENEDVENLQALEDELVSPELHNWINANI